MIPNRLKAFLDENAIKYVSIRHSPAYTAAEVAASAHVAARDFAKTIVMIIDGEPTMLVIPANRRLALHEMRELLEPAEVRLATESELRNMFPDCELGAMPPFGNLYGMPVRVTAAVADRSTIAFNGGTHTEIIQILYEDFDRLVKPRIIEFITT